MSHTSQLNQKRYNLYKAIFKAVIVAGNTLTMLGILGVTFGLIGLINLDYFVVGISSGIRIIGSVAIAGCLISAVGYGFIDYVDDI